MEPTIRRPAESGWAAGAASVSGLRPAGGSMRLARTMSGRQRTTSDVAGLIRGCSEARRFFIRPWQKGNDGATGGSP